MNKNLVLVTPIESQSVERGQSMWDDTLQRYAEVLEVSVDETQSLNKRVTITFSFDGLVSHRKYYMNEVVFVKHKQGVNTNGIVEIPRTGHVFVRDSIRAMTPLEPHLSNWFTDIIGVGFSVRVCFILSLDERIQLFNGLDKSSDRFRDEADARALKAAQDWYQECRRLIFGG